MDARKNHSNRTPLLLTAVCLVQFITFIGITLIENNKREVLHKKLEIRREAIVNISANCIIIQKKNEHSAEYYKDLHRLIRQDSERSLSKRQISQGINGTIQSQLSLLQKACTNDTKICLRGSKGENGLPGDQGNAGLKGDVGTKGRQGFKGELGGKGAIGIHGLQGIRGPKGSKGNGGLQGSPGIKGMMGDIGGRGVTGTLGILGIKGDPGPVGEKGKQGPNGLIGLKGTFGLKGETGLVLVGEHGETGQSGDMLTLNKTNCECTKKIEFIDKTKVITAALGSTITLNCTTVEGQAASWTHKSDRTCYTSTNNGSIINIEHLSPADLGEHVCTVDNALYSVDKTINVKSLDYGDGVSCDFENAPCGLQLVNWSIASKEKDHTTGTTMGHYLSTNGNNGSNITSLWIKGGSPLCLSFWYKNHVTGSVPISIVNVTVHGNPCRQDQTYTHTIGKKHETNWTEQYIQLPINMNIMKIEIDAYNNDTWLSIDDIQITTKNCPIEYLDFCNFDKDFCQWQQGIKDNFDWSRRIGETSSTGTGPVNDHTTGNSYYIYTEASSPRRPGDKADLLSPFLQPGTQYCLTLYYNMYGSSMGYITIYTEEANAGKRSYRPPQSITLGQASQSRVSATRTTLFTLKGDHGQGWHKQQVNIPPSTITYRIVISGTRGSSIRSDMAIDDVTISSGICH